MSHKILFYLDLFTLHFALANYLQNNIDCELFALIDTTDKPKRFFENQEIVHFKKSWFYHDEIDTKMKPDLKYISEFSEKFDIDIEKFIENDRHFNHYNEFYEFSENEKKSIVTQESKLYESIIDEIKPDFLIITQPSLRHSYFLYEICKKNGIKPLVINPSLLGYQTYVSSHINRLDSHNTKNLVMNDKSFGDLRLVLQEHNVNTQIIDYIEKFGNSKVNLMKAAFEFLFRNNNSNIKTHYTYFGRTKLKVLRWSINNRKQKSIRKKFIDENLDRELSDENFIYFPLQVEPDRNLLLGAPDYTDQLKSIKEITRCLPNNYKLYVKEHPGQNRTWRKIEFYKEILNLENVKLIHPSFPSKKIYEKCDLVITAAGTSGFEALFYGIPVITFADTLYSDLTSVRKINSFSELEVTIKKLLEQKSTPDELNGLLQLLKENSIDFDLFGYYTIQAREFFHDSNLIDVEINPKQMFNFLEKQSKLFNMLGDEIIKKINTK